MATLTRWSRPIPPKWLGNDLDPQPFTLRYKRLSRGELRAFSASLEQMLGGEQTAEQLAVLFGSCVQGPFAAQGSVALAVDGVEVQALDLAGLLQLGMDENPVARDQLLQEIIDTLLLDVNGMRAAAQGESSGSRGGGSTTRADRSEGEPAAASAAA